MTTQFQALRLNPVITTKVMELAAKYHVDLNSVDHWSDNMIVVGFSRTGLEIQIRKHGAITLKGYELEAGTWVEMFVDGTTVESHNLIGEGF